MTKAYYSQRTGANPHPDGLPLGDIVQLFVSMYDQLRADGYFDEAFGFDCVDAGEIQGNVSGRRHGDSISSAQKGFVANWQEV